MSNATVRAVDLGFGSVKYVLDHKANADVICGLFPSHAPFSIWQPGAGGHKQSDTIDVVVGTDTYEVGKDIARRLSANHGRVLDRNYPETKTYAALLKGALAYMAQPKIEILILGLPINNYYEKYAALLKEVATGSHVVPNIMHRTDPRAPKMVTVNVEETFVIPQPMGGLFDHFIRSRSYAEMKEQVSLVIDAGFFTFGWVTAHGGNPNLRCSGAKFGSMSDALMQIADGIEREHGLEIGVDLVDAAIRAGTSMTLFGVEQDITKHISAGKSKAREIVAAIASNVGNGANIHNVVLTGGGAYFFLELVQEKFPAHDVVVAKDPVFANVRGFQLVGEDLLHKKLERKRSAEPPC